MMYLYYLEYVNPAINQTVDFHDLRSNVIDKSIYGEWYFIFFTFLYQ